jgi:hypothetical protein
LTARITRNAAHVWKIIAKMAVCLSACAPKPRKKRSNRETQFVVLMEEMKLLSKRKIMLLALALCLVMLVVFAETLITGSHDHDCTGTNCLICLRIEMAKSLKLISLTLLFISCLAFFALIPKICAGLYDYSLSPVMLKVRFNT